MHNRTPRGRGRPQAHGKKGRGGGNGFRDGHYLLYRVGFSASPGRCPMGGMVFDTDTRRVPPRPPVQPREDGTGHPPSPTPLFPNLHAPTSALGRPPDGRRRLPLAPLRGAGGGDACESPPGGRIEDSATRLTPDGPIAPSGTWRLLALAPGCARLENGILEIPRSRPLEVLHLACPRCATWEATGERGSAPSEPPSFRYPEPSTLRKPESGSPELSGIQAVLPGIQAVLPGTQSGIPQDPVDPVRAALTERTPVFPT